MSASRSRSTPQTPRTLRALRREPALIDDRLFAERLTERPELTTEGARWARAWLVCWQAALVADDRYGLDEPWEIAFLLRRVTTPKGGGDAARREVVLAALAATGLVRLGPLPAGGRGRGREVRLTREAFVEHPAAMGVDWPGVVASCPEPAPLLVLRALAELTLGGEGPTSFVSVPRRDLVAATGYGPKQVRVAVRRLTALGLLEAEGDTGTTARYRLAPRAVGQPWRATAVPPGSASAPTGRPTPGVPRRGAPAQRGTATRAGAVGAVDDRLEAAPEVAPEGAGLDVVLGGVTVSVSPGSGFEIGPGMVGRVERGPDGRPRLVVRPNG